VLLVLIFLAGGLGSVCRYGLGSLVQSYAHVRFPVGTLAVNVIGCLVVGALGKFFLHAQTETMARGALVVGFCGGFTTFSTFSYEVFGLLSAGDWPRAVAYAAMSLVACVLGTAVGFAAGSALNP
jgi:CrcB protein